jgi:hypothetical protein
MIPRCRHAAAWAANWAGLRLPVNAVSNPFGAGSHAAPQIVIQLTQQGAMTYDL